MKPASDEQGLALHYGRVCRGVFSDCRWEQCEEQVRRHWEKIRGDDSWERVRATILEGWNQGSMPPG